MKPNNFEESVIWYSILGTYIFYFAGVLYFVPAIVAWILVFYIFKRFIFSSKSVHRIPYIITMWIFFMLLMEVILLLGHANYNLGLVTLIKSTLGWAKGWALFAIFPLIGSCLDIRPQLLYRAISILCIQSLVYIFICILAFFLKIDIAYTVPLHNLLGGGERPFLVDLYKYEGSIHWLRLKLFTSWSTISGCLANMYFPMCLQERNHKLRYIGIITTLLMLIFSGSRSNIVLFPIIWILVEIITNVRNPILWFTASFASVTSGLFSNNFIFSLDYLVKRFEGIRESSSDTRGVLDRIALRRFMEAPITGHGISEAGPEALVNSIPIGTQNTWTGLLFVKGLSGFLAFAIPVFITTVLLALDAQSSKIAKVALHVFLAMIFNTVTDDVQATVYFLFPGLVLIGISFRKNFKEFKIFSNS
jgi:hypothetical protein